MGQIKNIKLHIVTDIKSIKINMNQVCRRCLGVITLRSTRPLHNHKQTATITTTNSTTTTVSGVRSLHTTTNNFKVKTGMAHLFKDGKRIVEETDDLTTLKHVLLKFTSLRMPAKDHFYQSVITDDSGGKQTLEYNLKMYERCISLENLKVDQVEVYLGYVYHSLPPGVSVDVQLMKWEEYADPDNPLLKKEPKNPMKGIMKKK